MIFSSHNTIIISLFSALSASFVPTANGCSFAPREGTRIHSIQATSKPNLLAANVGVYDATSHIPITTKEATIDIFEGTITPGWPEDVVEIFTNSAIGNESSIQALFDDDDDSSIKVFPNGPLLHRSVDANGWILDIEGTADPPMVTMVRPYGHTTGGNLSPKSASFTVVAQFELPHSDPSAVANGGLAWFVSEKFNRAYVLYNNATVATTSGSDGAGEGEPPAVVAIVPLSGDNDSAFYVPFTEMVHSNGDRTTATAYDDIQMASLPANICGRTAVFFTEDSVEARNELFNFGVQSSYEGRKTAQGYRHDGIVPLDFAYKVADRPNEVGRYDITLVDFPTGKEKIITSLTQDDVSAIVYGIPEFSLCPADRPTSLDTCSGTYTCSYGEDCCCGQCHPSVKYTCVGGTFISVYPDKCFRSECEEEDSNSGSSSEEEQEPENISSESAVENSSDGLDDSSEEPENAERESNINEESAFGNGFNIGVRMSGAASNNKRITQAWTMATAAAVLVCTVGF